MIFLYDNINVETSEVRRIYKDYLSFVGEKHLSACSARAWDYAAIVVNANFSPTDIILDIGCGVSYLSLYLAQFVAEAHGIDDIENGNFLKFNRPWLETLQDFEVYRNGKFVLHDQNAAKLPFVDEYFDKIVTVSAMEHFAGNEDSACVKEIYRVLKPGGYFLGTVDYNGLAEYPLPGVPGCRAYTYEAFWRRIVRPSGLSLKGRDFLGNAPILQFKSITKPLFFHLVKEAPA